MDTMTNDQKRAYIDRIDAKAKEDNISVKHAARKLSLKDWKYYQYKNDIKRNIVPTLPEKDQENTGPVNISVLVTAQAYQYLKNEAQDFAIEPAIVAQLLLHHAIMKGVRTRPASIIPSEEP